MGQCRTSSETWGTVAIHTPCNRLPSLPDQLSSDCIAVVHGLGLRLVIQAMVAGWLQGSFGASENWLGWAVDNTPADRFFGFFLI